MLREKKCQDKSNYSGLRGSNTQSCRCFSKYWAYAHYSEFSNQNNSTNDSANTQDKIYFPNSGQTIFIHNRHKGRYQGKSN